MEGGDNSLTRRDTVEIHLAKLTWPTRWEQYPCTLPPIEMILMIVPPIDNGFIIDRRLCCGNSNDWPFGKRKGGGWTREGGKSWRTPKAETRSLK